MPSDVPRRRPRERTGHPRSREGSEDESTENLTVVQAQREGERR